jgi:hypothetical protein
VGAHPHPGARYPRRGSELLLPQTVARRQQSGARAHIVPRMAHAPALMAETEIAAIRAFLLEERDASAAG